MERDQLILTRVSVRAWCGNHVYMHANVFVLVVHVPVCIAYLARVDQVVATFTTRPFSVAYTMCVCSAGN